ncbi:hypothetical protein [Nocardioides sp. AX2bis]|uniref:hypothetical protein n=1 Tax=Nocardioides sp. AX2bis TaxID=2653157 RepID=UPI001914FE92|nr:hypothetical protein [Nocardioides sp. AX2bis]
MTAARFGIEESLLAALPTHLESAPVVGRLRPALAYVAKLAATPDRITPSDAEAVLSAGWFEKPPHDAVSICGRSNLTNRLISGDYFETSGERLAEGGYAGLADLL